MSEEFEVRAPHDDVIDEAVEHGDKDPFVARLAVTTAILARFMLDEPLTAQLVAGGAVVIVGLMVVQVSEARARVPVLAEEPAPG